MSNNGFASLMIIALVTVAMLIWMIGSVKYGM